MFVGDSSDRSAVYGLPTKARSISAQIAEQDKSRFLVGTVSLKEENEVHLIEVVEDENEIKCINIFSHPGEIWCLEPSPNNTEQFIIYFDSPSGDSMNESACLWEMNHEDSILKEKTKLSGIGSVKDVSWNLESPNDLLFVEENKVNLYKMKEADIELVGTVGEGKNWWHGLWHPLHPEQFAVTSNGSVQGWDTRSMKETYSLPKAHPFVRDFDFNPNKDYFVVTGGDDSKVKFWDTRRPDSPLTSFSGHSHWVWNVRYNRYHDQLVLSSSTDTTVNLWNAVSVSSSSSASVPANWDQKKHQDHLVKAFDEHEDSVYSIAWGTSPWVFASLSYDGRVVINYVPKDYVDQIMMK